MPLRNRVTPDEHRLSLSRELIDVVIAEVPDDAAAMAVMTCWTSCGMPPEQQS
jgi:hypothetical protein